MKKIICFAVMTFLVLMGCSTTTNSKKTNALETLTFDSNKEYAYEDFEWNQFLDEETGYLKDIKALDYVVVPDLSSLKVRADEINASDRDAKLALEQYVQSIGVQMPHTQVFDRMSKLGDTVNIDYAGKVKDITFVGGTAQSARLELGSGTFIPGFEEQVVGHMPGEDFDITVTFPEGYGNAKDNDGNEVVLSGQEAVFSIHLNYIEEWHVTDEWVVENVQEFLQVSTAQALDEKVRSAISQGKRIERVSRLMDEEIEVKEIPNILIDHLATSVLYLANQDAVASGTTLDEFLKQQNMQSQADLLSHYADAIKSRARQYLICQAIAESYDIDVDLTISEAEKAMLEEYGEGYIKNGKLCTAAVEYVASHMTVEP